MPEVEKHVEKKSVVKSLVAGIDINKLVKKAQESYEKKEAGLAKQLATGDTITASDEDKDYVVWTGGDHWKSLTSLRGLPMGRICQISGKPDSGKSTHAAAFMKYAQDQDILVICWDSERKFNKDRFDNLIGGSSKDLLVVNTNKIIDGARAVAHLISAAKEMNPNIRILCVWDSCGASVNSTEDSEEETENYSKQPGVTAKEVAYTVRKFNKLINKYMNQESGEHTLAFLIINQTYSSIGIGPSVQIEKGGTELFYLSSLIIQLSRKQDLTRAKDGDKYKYGIVSRAKVKKNHMSSNNETIAELDIVVSASGIQLASEVKSFKDIEGWNNEENEE
jgi:RecA/RadA recombinase